MSLLRQHRAKAGKGVQQDYLEIFTRRNRMTWVVAVLSAIGVNFMLFMVMPMLQGHHAEKNLSLEVVPDVSVVHVPHKKQVEHLREPISEKHPLQIARPREPVPHMPKPAPVRLDVDLSPLAEMPDMDLVPPAPAPLNPEFASLEPPDGAFSPADLDAPIGAVVRVPPVYPMRARQRKVEGWVRVKFLVDERGEVAEVKIVEAEPKGYFEGAVRRCVSRWRFSQALVAGRPVKVWMETTIRFRLED